MKALITLSVFSLISLPTYASLKGTLDGSCTLTTATSSKTLSFSVPNNKKAVTNLSDALFIEVANNLESNSANTYGAAYISVSRKNAGFSNPPELCPSFPVEAKEACEARNAANAPAKVVYSENSFELVKHNGGPASIWITLDNSGPVSMTFARVELSKDSASKGGTLEFPTYTLNGTTISCASRFINE